MTNKTRRTILSYEAGEIMPTLSAINDIAYALDTSYICLLSDNSLKNYNYDDNLPELKCAFMKYFNCVVNERNLQVNDEVMEIIFKMTTDTIINALLISQQHA